MKAIRVLIIEDDARIADMHRFFVEKVQGFEVVGIALNLGEALEMVTLLDPDLLLLDLYLPDGHGMDILHQLRGQGKAVDVILITAARNVDTVQQALRAGAFDYLVKPVIFSRFERAMNSFIAYHSQLRQGQTLAQRDIDQLRHPHQLSSGSDEVPKGIDVLTLGKVRQVFTENLASGFSAEEVGEEIGASRSTARRYLEYMITTGELKADLVYGSVGRPERRYFLQQG
ncbi:two-component system, CitB family, response regulator/two-component system, CitB family, response regulator DcuR [Desulfocicer vacuolatum DSM 3385]|uniref:Transcriptional regulatory protein n=1 Tax=Desulfocicer vacuolatum DSM 3385 TaxID=1121400 RepID=A0A1W2C0A4_9BACT|nr:response regulator [Desulfocicer vacuolatum]SMC78687.1 two-component system, CitB family, response regulator/two-component system, CitB family, response regulator DcuR [Desulfocicer vacuolatum DSM 3385]